MDELILHQNNLPKNIEDLSKFVLIGREKLKSVRAEIKAIEKLHIAEEVRTQKRDEAQMLSEALLDAEVKIGELLKEIPQVKNNNPIGTNRYSSQRDSSVPLTRTEENELTESKSKIKVIEDLGFTKKQAQRFEILAKNKDVVEEVKREARENDDIPTRSRVIDLVAEKKRQEENYYRKLDLGLDTYKKLAKIYDVIDDFDITDERIEALMEYFDKNMPLEEQLEFLSDATEKIQQIRIALLRGKKYEKNIK